MGGFRTASHDWPVRTEISRSGMLERQGNCVRTTRADAARHQTADYSLFVGIDSSGCARRGELASSAPPGATSPMLRPPHSPPELVGACNCREPQSPMYVCKLL